MGKALGFIVGAITLAVGIATGNVALIVSGALQLAGATVSLLFGPHAQPPETTEQAIKTPRPPRVKAYGTSRLYGASALFEAVNGTTVDVWAYADGRANAVLRTYLNDDQVTLVGDVVQAGADKRYQNGHVRAGWNLGLPVETAFSAITTIFPDWDANHRGDGIVTGFLIKTPDDQESFLETYPQGDNVVMSLVCQWQLLFDPRNPAHDPYDSTTWAWSDNAVLAFVHYLMVERGNDWATKFAPNLTKLLTAINIADEDVPLAAGGTEKRYRTSLSYKATEVPANVIASLLACFDGWYAEDAAGAFVIYAGAAYTPTVTIGPDQISDYRHQANVEGENIVNEIAVPYVSDLHDYNSVDGEAWRDDADIAARGVINTTELNAVVPSHTQGRRLAKPKMARTNASDRGTVSTLFSGRIAEGERFINLVIEEAGATFFEGVAEIIGIERNQETGGLVFEWVKYDPNSHTWNPATEDGEGAPVGNRYAPAPIATPVITSATVEFSGATDTGSGARVRIFATSDVVDAGTWYARWREGAGGAWNEQAFPDLDASAGVEILTGFVPISADVEVAVRVRAPDGRNSEWSTAYSVDTRTDITAPDAAGAVALDNWTDAIRLTTARIARASTYRWRFYASDGTTLVKTITTAIPEVAYASATAAVDGALRSYKVDVAGINAAGTGTVSAFLSISKAAPAAVSSPAIAGGADTATATCGSVTGAAGYVVFYGSTAAFDPATTGGIVRSGITTLPIYGLAAGTYYGRLAAYDAWSANPALLNLSTELSFTITTGGGSTPSGGGDGGGGYGGGGGGGPGTMIP